jgi:hypothetical protein
MGISSFWIMLILASLGTGLAMLIVFGPVVWAVFYAVKQASKDTPRYCMLCNGKHPKHTRDCPVPSFYCTACGLSYDSHMYEDHEFQELQRKDEKHDKSTK